MQPVVVSFSNKMQTGSYERTRPVGDLSDCPDFKPFYTPAHMLEMGVFEGKYLNSCVDEYPAEWFESAVLSDVSDEKFNYFKLKSRLPTSWWREKGLIHEQDPRGWFEWYCRFWMGRRTADDARQIKRWKQIARHSGQVLKNGGGDINKRARQRQTLLQWSWNPFPDFI
jgi:hypothetical protein